MDNSDNNIIKQRAFEIFVTTILSIHHISIAVITYFLEWPVWFPVVQTLFVVFLWLLVVGRFRSLKVRVYIMAILMEISIVLYIVYSSEFNMVILAFSAVAVMLALFGYSGVIVTTLLTNVIVFVLQLFVTKAVDFHDTTSFGSAILVFANANFIQLMLLFWVYKSNITQKNVNNYIQLLKTAQKGKDDFIANVSHEIRTPINTISGLTDILIEEEDPTKLKADLNRIRTAGRSLMFVVSDILDFSELEKGEIQLEEENYNISSTINDVVNQCNSQSFGKPVELIVNYESSLPRGLIGDEKKIRRALLNIMGNAFKFTEHGCVVLDIGHREEAYGINLQFTVRDTGIGMKQEELDRLFSVYNQVDSSRSRAEGGIGLGLAISRAIIQKMGGTISVFSEYEKGTEVRIVIPQKVIDSRPIIEIEKAELIHVGVYLNLEQFAVAETRDEYVYAIRNMQNQLKIKSSFCRNLAELKRRQASSSFTHLFISMKEYMEDTRYFDSLSEQLNLILILDPELQQDVLNDKIYQIFKPFQLMPIAQAINNHLHIQAIDNAEKKMKRFTTKGVRVLAVDDNEMNIRVVAGLLKRYNVQTIQALSGKEALERVISQDYDFIFMDHMMPEMDGVECLHHIRNMAGAYYRTVPIVALTANAVAGAREMLLGEGFNDFIEKPIEISTLERLLIRVLPPEKVLELTELPNQQTQETPNPKEETKPSYAEVQDNFTVASLDREKAYLYCGGEEAYDELLRVYATKGADNYLPIAELFEKQDWANYIIMIHGIKSSMKALGAEHLSELARQLEMAGKENDFGFILEHHDAAFQMYRSLIHDIMKYCGVSEAREEQVSDLPEVSQEQMNACLDALENAMYDLDGDRMLAAIEELAHKKYKGKALDSILAQVNQKIQMSDYISAGEMLLKLRG